MQISPLMIILAAIVIIGGGYVIMYNGLVRARLKVKEAWSGITVQLKRRYDLIPNLVSVVKGYASHEKETLEKVIQARSSAISVPEENIAEKSKAENFLSSTLKSIFALAENYPDLKANQNFLELQSQIAETEDQIAASRRIYNGNVTNLNVKIENFPSNLIAGIHGFKKEEFFEVENLSELQKAPEVKF